MSSGWPSREIPAAPYKEETPPGLNGGASVQGINENLND